MDDMQIVQEPQGGKSGLETTRGIEVLFSNFALHFRHVQQFHATQILAQMNHNSIGSHETHFFWAIKLSSASDLTNQYDIRSLCLHMLTADGGGAGVQH